MTSSPGRHWWTRLFAPVLAGTDPRLAGVTPEAFLLDATFYGCSWSLPAPPPDRPHPAVPHRPPPVPAMRRPCDPLPARANLNNPKDDRR